nr:hypothetical protein [Comamonas testosteroni]
MIRLKIKTGSRKPARQMLSGGGALQQSVAASALAAGCQAGLASIVPQDGLKRLRCTPMS